MITRDFLLRQIQQLVAVVARVFLLRNTQQEDEALDLINRTFRQSELDVLLSDDLDQESVLAICTFDNQLSAEKAIALADVLFEKAQLAHELEEQQPAARYALWLYERARVIPGAAVPLDLPDRLEFLRDCLATEE